MREFVYGSDADLRRLQDSLDRRLERLELVITGLSEELGLFCGAVIAMDDRLKAFEERSRQELLREIEEVRDLVSPTYSALDHRIRMLEIHRELEGRDPIELIKERFGFGPKSE